MKRRTKLSEFSVRDEELSQGLQTLESLATVLLSGLLVNRHIRLVGLTGIEMRGIPDEFLEQVAVILGEPELFRLINDVTQILNEPLAFAGEFFGGRGESLRLESAVQCDITLPILLGLSDTCPRY